jgi:D-glycero-alpha-D-manno-heptose-7-phosphate kinase
MAKEIMIISSCPLRISLVGGSTDHPYFIEKYENGSVISFPSNLRTYVSIHRDAFGMNSIEHKYSINYSKKECVQSISEIQNKLIRHCFEYLDVKSMNCSLTSDIYSVGSGLAASSSYLLSLVKSIYLMRNISITEFEICKIAEKIEKRFNPLVGQQDFYGSMGGLKRINFHKNQDPEFRFLSPQIFNEIEMYLIYTGIIRNSTAILESLDIEKSLPMLGQVESLEKSIKNCDIQSFNRIINESWLTKKTTSKYICENQTIISLDKSLTDNSKILSHKLCGAGNGGYFLVFANKNSNLERDYKMSKKISISETGLNYHEFK